jgi:hypothetical protein
LVGWLDHDIEGMLGHLEWLQKFRKNLD